MRPWLAFAFGLGIACTALYLLAVGDGVGPVASGPPESEIDDASRAELERVLERSDRVEAGSP